MNREAKAFIKNFYYTLISNIISLLTSMLVVLIVPKLIGISEYGYWQLYIFYSSYVGFLHFGWISGIYLKLGGKHYQEIDKKTIGSQFYLLFILQVLIALLIVVSVSIFGKNPSRIFIFYMIALSTVLINMRDLIIFIFQATSRIKDYAKVVSIGKLLYLAIIILLLILGLREYKLMIIADLIGILVSLLYAIYISKDIVFSKPKLLRANIKESAHNIRVGSKLMTANIVSMLIIGVVRFGIERTWDVETFGKVSLTLSVSNLMMVFINALGIIIFPMLRRTNKDKLSDIYLIMRDFLMVVLFGLLIGYYPIKFILSAWLPKYSDSLKYMALVFPMIIYEGKMALLINSYLKSLRKEMIMLKINIVSVIISILFTISTTILLRNIDLAIQSIVVIVAIRSILAETVISKMINTNMKKDTLLEIALTLVFILSGWFINSWIATAVYGTVYLSYLLIKSKDIRCTANGIKMLSKA